MDECAPQPFAPWLITGIIASTSEDGDPEVLVSVTCYNETTGEYRTESAVEAAYCDALAVAISAFPEPPP